MRILHLNTSASTGGAARAMLALHAALRAFGCDSRILSLEARPGEPGAEAVPLTAFGRALRRAKDERWVWSNRTDLSNTHYTLIDHGADALAHPLVREADVLHLHWTTGLLSIGEIGEILASGKPCAWTFHDEWAYTGGCHFSAGCDAWRAACDSCPQLRSDPRRLVARQFARKKSAYARGQCTVVAPSRWIAARSRTSALLSHMPAVVIENGVDLENFHPSRRAAGRAELGVDDATAVLVFGAGAAAERRKGMRELREALSILERERAPLGLSTVAWKAVVVGDPNGVEMPQGAVVLGHIADRARLASIVAAADLALLPSLEDNLPNAVSEALACGTACVAFAAGGVPEMLEGVPGCGLAAVGDARDFAREIAARLRELDATRASSSARRKVAEARYSTERCAHRHHDLYQRLRARRLGETASEPVHGLLPPEPTRSIPAPAGARDPAPLGWKSFRILDGLDLRSAQLALRLYRRERRKTAGR